MASLFVKEGITVEYSAIEAVRAEAFVKVSLSNNFVDVFFCKQGSLL